MILFLIVCMEDLSFLFCEKLNDKYVLWVFGSIDLNFMNCCDNKHQTPLSFSLSQKKKGKKIINHKYFIDIQLVLVQV